MQRAFHVYCTIYRKQKSFSKETGVCIIFSFHHVSNQILKNKSVIRANKTKHALLYMQNASTTFLEHLSCFYQFWKLESDQWQTASGGKVHSDILPEGDINHLLSIYWHLRANSSVALPFHRKLKKLFDSLHICRCFFSATSGSQTETKTTAQCYGC